LASSACIDRELELMAYAKTFWITFDRDGQPDFVTAIEEDARQHAQQYKQTVRPYDARPRKKTVPKRRRTP
jgi:hypothetical protein